MKQASSFKYLTKTLEVLSKARRARGIARVEEPEETCCYTQCGTLEWILEQRKDINGNTEEF